MMNEALDQYIGIDVFAEPCNMSKLLRPTVLKSAYPHVLGES